MVNILFYRNLRGTAEFFSPYPCQLSVFRLLLQVLVAFLRSMTNTTIFEHFLQPSAFYVFFKFLLLFSILSIESQDINKLRSTNISIMKLYPSGYLFDTFLPHVLTFTMYLWWQSLINCSPGLIMLFEPYKDHMRWLDLHFVFFCIQHQIESKHNKEISELHETCVWFFILLLVCLLHFDI